jgi:WD40 repeat protein
MWVQRVGGGVKVLAYAPDSKTLFTHDGGAWVYAWDLATRARRKLLSLDYKERTRLYRDGLFTVGDRYLIAEPGGRARGWNLIANAPLTDLPETFGYGFSRPAHTGPVVQFVTHDQKGLETYDLATGLRKSTHRTPPKLKRVARFAVSPDGSAVLVDGSAHAALVRADGASAPLPDFYGSGVRFSPDGNSLLWLHGDRAQIWNAADLSVRVESIPSHAPYSVIAFHPTAPVFAAPNPRRELTLFRLDTGEAVRSFDFGIGFADSVCFSPDGLTCAVGGSNKQFAVFDVDL